jgi:hypothetical protein
MPITQYSRQLTRRLEPILQWQNNRLRSDHGSYGLRRLWYLPGFHRYQYYIRFSGIGGIVGGLHGIHHKITFGAIHPQAIGQHRLEVISPGDKHNIFFCLGKPPAKIPPYPSATKDCDTH